MDLRQAKQFMAQKYPNDTVQWVDKGQMNFIAIVGGKYVFKFPKTPEYYRLLQKEHALYKLLQGKTTLPIPESIELNQQHHYLQLSYVAGRTVSLQQAISLMPAQKADLAHKLATLVKQLNVADVKTAFDEIAKTDPNDFYYVENWLKKTAVFCQQNSNDLTKRYLAVYAKFTDALPYGFCVGNLLAHKDLHEDNMLFDDNDMLIGVIDFAEVRYTNLHSELRTVIRFGDDVVMQILDELGDLADGVQTQDIKLFATVYEMAIVVQNTYIKNELPWRVDQANFYLDLWA